MPCQLLMAGVGSTMRIPGAITVLLLLTLSYVSAEESPLIEEPKNQCEDSGMTWSNWSNWCLPTIILSAELARAVTFTECRPISGLTCRITLLPSSELPDRIYVQPKDSDGNSIGKEWRLVYPDLVSRGWTSGIATFLGPKAVELHLRGVWLDEQDPDH